MSCNDGSACVNNNGGGNCRKLSNDSNSLDNDTSSITAGIDMNRKMEGSAWPEI